MANDPVFYRWARMVPETCGPVTEELRERLNRMEGNSPFPNRESCETKSALMSRWIIECYADGTITADDLNFLRNRMRLESELPYIEVSISAAADDSSEIQAQMDFMIGL